MDGQMKKKKTHSGDDGAAEVLQVGDDVAVLLHVSVLDELCEVLFSNACWGGGVKEHQLLHITPQC